MLPGVEEKRLVCRDGTELCYYLGGTGPAVVLANGLGGPLASFRHLLERLAPDYSFLTWDYRGTFRSRRPTQMNTLSVAHQVDDLHQLLEAEEIDQAVVLGWSMGVQVSLEFQRRHPEQVAGLVLCCGVAGRPFQSLGVPLSSKIGPPLVALGKRAPKLISVIARRMTQWPHFVPIMQRVGFVSPTLDMEVFRAIAQDYASVDIEVYCETLLELGRHDAFPYLRDINVPSLIIAGARDRLTPSSISSRMHRDILGSQLCVVERGTHYTPLEFPQEVTTALDRFLAGVVGYEPSTSRPNYA